VWTFALTALAVLAAAATGGYQMSRHVPARIGALNEIPFAFSTAAAREKAQIFYLGVATETSAERTQRTWAGLRDALLDTYSPDPRLWRADRYGELALALEQEKIDAAFLPGASAYTLLKRTHLGVHVVAQTRFRGATTYTGVLVGRPGLEPTAESLTGARVAFVEPDSLSGYIAPEQWLSRKGLHLADLGEVIFAGNHTNALQLLASGRADVAATFDSALEDFRSRDPSLKLVELARFEQLPNAMLVTRASMSDEEGQKLVESLQRVWDEPQLEHARTALAEGAAMDGLVPATVDVLHGVGDWFE
jgi:phosphate/phosphite/phosphonate ABC transporter binding protein